MKALRIWSIRLFENYFVYLILTFYFLVFIYVYTGQPFASPTNFFHSVDNLVNWLLKDFYGNIKNKESIIITVSAVFIGIYFTIFSLLGNIRDDSTLNILSEDHFNKLLNYIFFAFLSSFGYLLISLFVSAETNQPWVKLIFLSILTYMFYSAFRFGLIMFYSYRNDFKQYKIRIQKEKEENIQMRNTLIKLEKYLRERSSEKQLEENKELKSKL